MKKTYIKPAVEEICADTVQMLATSGEAEQVDITIEDGLPVDNIVFH